MRICEFMRILASTLGIFLIPKLSSIYRGLVGGYIASAWAYINFIMKKNTTKNFSIQLVLSIVRGSTWLSRRRWCSHIPLPLPPLLLSVLSNACGPAFICVFVLIDNLDLRPNAGCLPCVPRSSLCQHHLRRLPCLLYFYVCNNI